MTSANIQIGAGDVTALLVQRQIDALDQRLDSLHVETEAHWAFLQTVVESLDQQGEAKFQKLLPALEAIATGYRLLSGKGRYKVKLEKLMDQENAVFWAFNTVLRFEGRGRGTQTVKDIQWALTVSIIRESDVGTTQNLLPSGHTEIAVKLSLAQEKEVGAVIVALRRARAEIERITDALKDIPAIERKARAAMTETLLAGLEPSVLRQIEGCMPGQRRVIEAKESAP